EIVLKSLERDPTRRYQSAAEMRDELLQFLATRSDGRVRHQLGKYVSELFTEERADIAKTVRRASEGELDPKPIGNIALEKLGHADAELDAEELEVPMPEPEQDAALAAELVNDGGSSLAETAEVDRSKMIDARKKNRRLADEVHRLQRRQNLLVALLGIVALLAAGLAMYHHLDTTQQEAEPIEIGNSRE
ncbi:MAG: hypothetical protein ACOC9W_02420, partial [Persicimonas sp.]